MHERAGLVHVLAEDIPERRVQEVRGGVVPHRVAPRLLVDRGVRARAETQNAVDDLRAHHDHTRRRGLRVGDHRASLVGGDRPAIAHLAPALRIERSAIQHDLDVASLVRRLDA